MSLNYSIYSYIRSKARARSSDETNLSKKERANLLFRRLKIPPANVRSFEACNFETIRIELQGDINVEKLKKAEAIQIRPGLKVQPSKELKRTTRVKVCWVEIGEEKDQAILDTLAMFGTVSGAPEYLTYELTDEEMTQEDVSNLRNIRSRERAVEIEIHQQIPSYVKIAGKRARVWYPGQNFTCGRCYKSFRSCPGKADRAECKRKGGKERDFEEFWEEVAHRAPCREKMADGEYYTTDSIEISRVPKEATKEQLLDLFKTEDIDVNPDNLITTTFPETWRLVNLDNGEMMREIVARMHGKRFQNRNLLLLPIQIPTPLKTQVTKEVEINLALRAEEAKQKEKEEAEKKERERLEREKQENERRIEDERRRLEEDEKRRLEDENRRRKDGERTAEQMEVGIGGPRAGAEDVGRGPASVLGGAVETAVSENTVHSFFNGVMSNIQSTFGVVRKNKAVLRVDNDKDKKSPPQSKPREDYNLQPIPPFQRGTHDPDNTGSPILKTQSPADIVVNKDPDPEPNPPPLPPLPDPVPAVPPAPAGQPKVSSPTGSILTIGSEDEIFSQNLLSHPRFNPTFGSDFARSLSETRRKASAVGKRKRLQVGLDSSASSSGDKPPPKCPARSGSVVPETPESEERRRDERRREEHKKKEEEKEEIAKKAREEEDSKIRKTFNIPVGFEMMKTQRKRYKKKMAKAKEAATPLDVIESSLQKGEPKKKSKQSS